MIELFVSKCVLCNKNTSAEYDKIHPVLFNVWQTALPKEIALKNFENESTEEINLKNFTVKLNDALETPREIARARAEEV